MRLSNYANKNQKVICLVEMKHSNLGEAKEQIKQTYGRLLTLLKQNCTACPGSLKQIIWQAYIFHSGAAPKGGYKDCEDDLKSCGFKEAWVRGDRDIAKYLRMEIKADLRRKNSRNRGHA